jgi:DNA-directed RNA polymerase
MLLACAHTLLVLLLLPLLHCCQGLDWLYVHLANVWGQGQDKLSFDGRRCAARLTPPHMHACALQPLSDRSCEVAVEQL